MHVTRDKSSVLVKLQLKVSLLKGYETYESEQNLAQNEMNRSIFITTWYLTANSILIQGNCRCFWIESEFPKFERIIYQFHEDNLSLTETHNVHFERNL